MTTYIKPAFSVSLAVSDTSDFIMWCIAKPEVVKGPIRTGKKLFLYQTFVICMFTIF